MSLTHQDIAKLRENILESQRLLALGMVTLCPLPHKFKQHRDHKPPWCETCGYAVTGERVREMGA